MILQVRGIDVDSHADLIPKPVILTTTSHCLWSSKWKTRENVQPPSLSKLINLFGTKSFSFL